jgi:hypothetical protein
MYLNIFDLDKTEYHVWNVVRNIQRRVSTTQGLLCWLLMPLVLVISINEVHASKVPVTDPGHNSNIQSPEIPQPPPPFDLTKIIDKAEHIVQRDQHNPDSYWVEDPAYRIVFTSDGITYTPILKGNLSPYSFSFQVTQIGASSGEVFWDNKKATLPVSKENIISYNRTPDIQEIYENINQGVEQSWILQKDPGITISSDLIITIGVKTSLAGKTTPYGGIEFVDRAGIPYVKYSKAVIIEAGGKRLEVATLWDEDASRIVLNIPGEWLGSAAYPVIVDPVLTTADIAVGSLAATDAYPAVAYDSTNYLVVFQSGTPNTSGTGSTDVRGVRVNLDGTIIDTIPLSIGVTAGNDDEHPSVAYDSANNRYLVIWETWKSNTSADIMLNTVTATGTVGTPTTLALGGSRILAFPSIACCDSTYALAVWGRGGNNGIRIIYLNGVLINKNTLAASVADPTGVLTNVTGPITEPISSPAISPKIIYTNSTVNKYLLVWEDFADLNGDIKAQIYTVGTGWGTSATAWSIAATSDLWERYPVPAFDGTNFLVAYQRGATGGTADIYGQFATTAGANMANPTSPFSIAATPGVDEVTPGLAWNIGSCSATPINRYMVAWGQGTTVKVSPVTTAGGVESVLTASVNTTSTKLNPALAANPGGCEYLLTWSDNRSGTATPYDIYAQRVGYPNISNISPSAGGEGNTISINGTGFGLDPGVGNRSTGTDNVKIGANQVPDNNMVVWTNTPSPRIDFAVPDGITLGTYGTSVTAGGWISNALNFDVTLIVTTTTFPSGHQWLAYPGATLAASGGTLPYTWSISSGALPNGMTLNNSTGAISGTPTGSEASEIVSFTVKVTDSSVTAKSATQDFSIIVYKLNTIAVSPANPVITRGQQIQFTAGGTWTDNYTQPDINSIVTWQSSNTLVATINSTGLATGQGLGAVNILATK